MARLEIRLLGPFDVTLGEEPVAAFESDTVRLLLAFLVVESHQAHAREKLAEFLWPERPSGAGLSNLRHALSVLRRAISDSQADPPFLLVTRQTILFNVSSNSWADVIDFDQQRTQSPDNSAGLQALKEVAGLFRGNFLEGLSAGNSLALEDWLLQKREHYNAGLLQVFKKLASHAELTGELEQALSYARRQVDLAPWDEQAHQQLMRLLALSGRRSEALAQFDVIRRQLAGELDVPPAPETAAIYKRIRAGQIKPPFTEVYRQHIRGYQLGKCIGVGHVGAVYSAHQPVVARDVAIKIVQPRFASKPSFIRRFELEARMVARLEHPHIVPLYDFWREPEGAFLVMRWLHGGDLSDKLADGPLPDGASARLVDQLSNALNVAHQQGVIHRDIKPANILLDKAGNAYLSDFGIATMIDAVEFVEQLSPANSTGSLGYLSPEAAVGGAITLATDIYSLGVVLFEFLTGKHPFPDLTPQALIQKHLTEPLPSMHEWRPELPPAVDDVIQQATAKDPADRFDNAPALADAYHRAMGLSIHPSHTLARTAEALKNPYRGLQAFQEADAPFFFGREVLTQRLLDRMKENDTGARFLAVVGPSGSGKSSAIKAGLLPALRAGRGPGSEKWFVVDLFTGDRPLEDLAQGLLGIAAESHPDLLAILKGDDDGLRYAVQRVLPNDDELLLIIDQFEALYDCAVSQPDRERLLTQIETAVNDPDSRLRIIIGLRADYYDRPLATPGFSHLLGRRTETVGPLRAGELVRAIEGPAIEAGAEFEPGLVAQIVADADEQPGSLPMLQYALTELFEHRRGRWLEHEAYREIGGLSGALVKRAESLYLGLDREGQQASRQLFLRLVSLGESPGDAVQRADTRQRVLRSELESLYDAGDQQEKETDVVAIEEARAISPIKDVIESFDAARLLTFDHEPVTREPTVEVAHEALIREWPRLRAWCDESKDQLRMQRQLALAAQEWLAAGKDPSYLLRGTRLSLFEEWVQTTDLALTETEQLHVDASLRERSARRKETEARLEHEASLERRSRNFLKALAGVLVVSTIVALSLMIYAFRQQRQVLEAYSLSLVAVAQQALAEGDTATALVLAQAANQISDPPLEARRTLLDAAYAPGARKRYEVSALFPTLQGPATTLAMGPDGQTALIGLAGGTIILWDWDVDKEIQRLIGHTGKVNDILFGPDGRTVLSAADDGLVIIWDLKTAQPIHSLLGHEGPVQSVDVSADGRWVVSGGYGGDSFRDPGQLILWELPSGLEIRRFTGHRAGLVDARFALDDSVIVASSGNAELLTDRGIEGPGEILRAETILWDMASGQMLDPLASFGDDAYSTTISPDGQKALFGSYYDNVATVVDLNTGETVQVLEGHHDAVSAVHFSADGRRAITGSHDGSLIVWNLVSGEVALWLRVHRGEISDLVVTPDGRTALSSSRDGELILWDLHDAADTGHYDGHQDMVYDVAHLPDGQRFLSVSGGSSPAAHSLDTSVRLWDVTTGTQLRSRDLPLEVIFQLDVTPDGKTALVAGMTPTVHILDASTLADIGRLEGHEGWVTAVDISPDGRQAVTASVDGSLILWDLRKRQLIRRFEIGAQDGLWAVAIGPDGRTALADTDTGLMEMWDLKTGEKLTGFELDGLTGEQGATGITYLPDGQSAIAIGNNGYIYHWDLQSGDLIRILGQHDGIRSRMEIAPDSRLALSSGNDGVLMLWDLESGELIRRFGTPGQITHDIDMSPDGQTALSGSSSTSIVRWRLDNPNLEELRDWIATNRAMRDLSCDERELYRIEPYCPD